MNTLDLNAYGVEEMNDVEMKKIEGGSWEMLIVAAIIILRLIFSPPSIS